MNHEFWPDLVIENSAAACADWDAEHNRKCMECATGGRCMDAVRRHYIALTADVPEVRQQATKPTSEYYDHLYLRPEDDPFDVGGEG